MLLAFVVLSVNLGACGGSENDDVTLTIGTLDTTEQIVLGQIYKQALEGAGYTVKTDFSIGSEPGRARQALNNGWISGFPEHLNTALNLQFGIVSEEIPSDAQAAYKKAKAMFEKEGLTAFPPTPFALANAVGLLRETAEKRGLQTVSDLKGESEDMTLAGPLICHVRLDCLGGIERYYGVAFGTYGNVDASRRYGILEKKLVDSSMLLTTDGRLSEKDKFVILAEDKHAFPAGNVIFVTSRKVVEEAGSDFEEAIASAQKGLTLPVMQELDAKVEIEKKDPAKVAAEYLKSIGYTD